MDRLYFLNNLLTILIEKEREQKDKCLNNWTVSEFAYHNGKESAYSELKKEISICLVSD